MRISLIVAASQNGVIGAGGKLPWRLPADLKRFKQFTMGRPILMGRKTFESIGKPLPGRTNIVITRGRFSKGHFSPHSPHGEVSPPEASPFVLTTSSIDEAIRLCGKANEIFVIGGASIYQQALPLADRIYLTLIHQDFEGDTRLFPIDKTVWKETSREDFPADSANPYPFSFLTLKNRGRSILGQSSR